MSRFTASISPGSVIGPQIVGVPEGKKSDSGEGATFLIVFITMYYNMSFCCTSTKIVLFC
jgi:hypothetical protein